MFSILCNVSTSNIDEINKEYLLNHVKRPFVSITTATYNLLCLVDTGAGASCLSAKAFQNLPKSAIKRKLAIPHGFSLKSAGGAVLHTVGRYEVEFKLLHRTVWHDFFVIQGLLSNGILGVDFISRQKLVIWGQGRVTKCAFLDQINGILQKSTAINNISTETPIQHDQPFIAAASTMTAQAHTVTKVDVNILNIQHQGPETQICAESTQDSDFDIIDGLVKVQNGKSFVLVVNNSDDTLTIDKGEYLANASTFNRIEAIHEIKTAKHEDELAKTIHLNTNLPNSQNERWERIKAQLDIKHLSPNVSGKYTSLFRKYTDIFSVHKYDIGFSDAVSHTIRLKSDYPLFTKQFRTPDAHMDDQMTHINNLKRAGCVEISSSPYNSPVFLVKKKDGSSRLVLDYRQINRHSLPDKYSIRDVRSCLDEIGKAQAKIFSCLDITSGYHQIHLDEASRPFTAFHVIGQPKLQWTRSPMGLAGSGSTFSKLMDIVMEGLNGVLNYIDDILCFSQNHDAHITVLEQTFKRLRLHNLKINPRKCEFGKETVAYLGFEIDANGFRPGDNKIRAISDFPPPSTTKKIRQFLGVANYFRTFIRDFTKLANPLIKLTTKQSEWRGGPLPPKALEAFNMIKCHLASRPCMAYPNFNKDFELYCDAATGDSDSQGCLGAFLVQKDKDDKPRAICYLSRTLKPHEMNMSSYLLEMKSAVWAINHLHHYLKGRKFKIISDNKPLVNKSNKIDKSINRLQQALIDFDAEIVHLPGRKNVVADLLSRNALPTSPSDNDINENIDSNIQEEDISLVTSAIDGHVDDFITQQNLDPNIVNIRTLLSDPKALDNLKISKLHKERWKIEAKNSIIDKQGIIRRRMGDQEPALLPQTMINDILKASHQTVFGGHGGITRTYERIAPHYYWPTIKRDVKGLVYI